jgi:GxxExxY protein
MNENDISYKIIGAALEIHSALGPGLLESVYESTLAYDLSNLGLKIETQVPKPLVYKEIKLEVGYRIDMLVEDKVIVEIKSVENLAPVHFAQTWTYLKLSDKKLALLINFNTKYLKEGIHRIVNNL